jgi:hypothetical protein
VVLVEKVSTSCLIGIHDDQQDIVITGYEPSWCGDSDG